MSGPVEWAVLIFVVVLAMSSFGYAWKVRSAIADYQIDRAERDGKYDMALAALQRDLQDKAPINKHEVQISDISKDVRHIKKNLEQHGVIYSELRDDVIVAKAEIARISKIVNGKH